MQIVAYGQFDAAGNEAPTNNNIGNWTDNGTSFDLSFWVPTGLIPAQVVSDIYPIVTFHDQPANHTWTVTVAHVSGNEFLLTINCHPQKVSVIVIQRQGSM